MRRRSVLLVVLVAVVAAIGAGAGPASAGDGSSACIFGTSAPSAAVPDVVCVGDPFCVNGGTVISTFETLEGLFYAALTPGSGVAFGACANTPPPQGPDRYIYCAGAGDVGADGKPLGLGQTLNLKFGEQVGSPFFPNATLGFWVKSVGLTCQLTPEQAALAAASTVKVNHTGAPNTQEGAQVYTFVNA